MIRNRTIWQLLLACPGLSALQGAPATAPTILSTPGQEGAAAPGEPEEGAEETAWPGELRVERGEGLAPLLLPRAEHLHYGVKVALVGVPVPVGRVTMSSEVEAFRESLLVTGTNGAELRETGVLTIHAEGNFKLYSMNATIETRVLPQAWPRFFYLYTHDGTETRRREIKLGVQEGVSVASYRKDTTAGAPKGTRIWREPNQREVPADILDMLSAVYLPRTLIREDLEELCFPLIDKQRVWSMTIRRGRRQRMELEAGTFDVVEIVLDPKPHEGEDFDEEKRKRFEGLFGMQGSIHLWVEERTGVPVRIRGDLPVGLIELGVDIELVGYDGTPPEFGRLE